MCRDRREAEGGKIAIIFCITDRFAGQGEGILQSFLSEPNPFYDASS